MAAAAGPYRLKAGPWAKATILAASKLVTREQFAVPLAYGLRTPGGPSAPKGYVPMPI